MSCRSFRRLFSERRPCLLNKTIWLFSLLLSIPNCCLISLINDLVCSYAFAQVTVSCSLVKMDYEGRSDGRSIKSMIAHVSPLKLVRFSLVLYIYSVKH